MMRMTVAQAGLAALAVAFSDNGPMVRQARAVTEGPSPSFQGQPPDEQDNARIAKAAEKRKRKGWTRR